ncbi:unnamed protein product, partial [Ectocarpus sp. 12 AP-2014]
GGVLQRHRFFVGSSVLPKRSGKLRCRGRRQADRRVQDLRGRLLEGLDERRPARGVHEPAGDGERLQDRASREVVGEERGRGREALRQ